MEILFVSQEYSHYRWKTSLNQSTLHSAPFCGFLKKWYNLSEWTGAITHGTSVLFTMKYLPKLFHQAEPVKNQLDKFALVNVDCIKNITNPVNTLPMYIRLHGSTASGLSDFSGAISVPKWSISDDVFDKSSVQWLGDDNILHIYNKLSVQIE